MSDELCGSFRLFLKKYTASTDLSSFWEWVKLAPTLKYRRLASITFYRRNSIYDPITA